MYTYISQILDFYAWLYHKRITFRVPVTLFYIGEYVT